MSGESSVINIATAAVGDAQPANFQMQHTGSVFRAAPTAEAEGETQAFRITNIGHLFISTDPADALDINLPADAATETTLSALNVAFAAEDFATEVTLAAINAKLASLGQKASAGSMPVVIASDQSSVPVNLSAPLPAGTNNIGDVDIASSLPAGTNNIGDVDIASALPTGGNTIGNVGINSPLPAGTNNIGDFDLASSIPAGTNNIGDVDIASALPTGGNTIGNVGINSPLPAGTNNIGDFDLASSIPAGTNNIGDVDIASALPTGANKIGIVDSEAKTPTATTIKSATVTVGTGAVRATEDGAAPGTTRVLLSVMPSPDATARFFFGDAAVANSGANRGVEVFPGEKLEFKFDAGDYFIISDTAGQDVHILEQE